MRGTRKDRGAAMVVALLVLTIIAFLGGLLLLMSQGERRVSSTFRQATVAFGNAEAGVETMFNQIPLSTAPISCVSTNPSCSGMDFYTGYKNGTPFTEAQVTQGQSPPQPGMNLGKWDWYGYRMVVTGTSKTFLVFVNQAVEIDHHADIATCRGTDYSDCNN